ncbi:MAG TPA: FAD:protein FMN transferase [Nitrospira sp.]|nr:FAD:protein FMN transferase [Nitrospira sp.]
MLKPLVHSVFLSVCLLQPVASAGESISHGSAPVVVKRAQTHMGTLVSITAVADTNQQAQASIEQGFREIKRLEQLLSTWLPESELSRVNRSAGLRPIIVSPETMELVSRSLEIARLTGGGFNIAVGPAVELWSVTQRQTIPTAAELDAIKPLVDWTAIRLDREAGTIFLPRTGMRIDVGGIGKGYAADRAVAAMRHAGASAGVVALSGDIKTFGRLPDGAKFPVGIQHPRREEAVLALIDLEDEAMSTAGDYERFFERDGVRYHHILDPVSLQPARDCQSVTIIAKDGVWADGLDTGIFVLGPAEGMKLVERLPGVEAIIVDKAGGLHVSAGLRERVEIVSDQTGELLAR